MTSSVFGSSFNPLTAFTLPTVNLSKKSIVHAVTDNDHIILE